MEEPDTVSALEVRLTNLAFPAEVMQACDEVPKLLAPATFNPPDSDAFPSPPEAVPQTSEVKYAAPNVETLALMVATAAPVTWNALHENPTS